MQIIPVIDIKNGIAVHAVKGERTKYSPLSSILSRSYHVIDMVQALLGLFPFKTLYLADIDAITNIGSNQHIIESVYHTYPQLNIWLDAGIARPSDLQKIKAENLTPVVASETFKDLTLLQDAQAAGDIILSLDFSETGLIGTKQLLDNPDVWPQRVIVMSLSRVGSQNGPELTRLQKLRAVSPQTQIFSAGGVRHTDDLLTLQALGTAGVLLASALHNGSISAPELQKFHD